MRSRSIYAVGGVPIDSAARTVVSYKNKPEKQRSSTRIIYNLTSPARVAYFQLCSAISSFTSARFDLAAPENLREECKRFLTLKTVFIKAQGNRRFGDLPALAETDRIIGELEHKLIKESVKNHVQRAPPPVRAAHMIKRARLNRTLSKKTLYYRKHSEIIVK
jgi:hypothetical protein